MRIWIGVSGFLIVLAIVAMIVKNQLSVLRATKPAAAAATSAPMPPQGEGAVRLPSDPAQLSGQYKRALDAALQTARPIESDVK